ncbi:MAG TPA: hypothetical protein VL490_07425 [Mucilaginibacter sp.]|jgi:hypothetical protein|nr:hypothetical protein [Mucilaginibacter sp.]
MKKLCLFLLLIAACNLTFAQADQSEGFKKEQLENKKVAPEELLPKFVATDFSKIWTQTENQLVYGFIGDDYQRIRIKFTSVTKGQTPGTYNVTGKSMVKGNVDDFHGTLKITGIRKLKAVSKGLMTVYKIEGIKGQYTMVGDYTLSENKNQTHAGMFKGAFRSDFYVDKNNQISYDNLEAMLPKYNNNQFMGSWIAYKDNAEQICNWGDYRIPNADDLDKGAGEFTPAPAFKKNGWETLHDAGENEKKSKAIEDAKWWVK